MGGEKIMKHLNVLLWFLIITLFAVLAVGALVTQAEESEPGFSVEVVNNTDHMIVFHLYWIDHPFRMYRPACIAVGEVATGKNWHSFYNKIGELYLIWFRSDTDNASERFTMHKDYESVTLSYDGEDIFIFRKEKE
jgi:hypothetical protein